MKGKALLVTFSVLFSVAVAGRQQPREYAIVDLGLLPGGGFAEAGDVNDRGQIVGWGGTATGEAHAILWDNGEVIDLGTLGGSSSRAWGINDHGQIVGSSETATGEFHAFLWDDGEVLDLASAGDFTRAFAINRRSEIVGHSDLEALLWRRGMLVGLGLPSAVAINDHGVIAGSDTINGEWHAVLWKGGEVTDLGVLPGGTYSSARSVNNRDQVVGESVVAQATRAFRWHNGEMVELRGLVSGGFSFGRAINNRGQSVGESVSDPNVYHGARHAVLWNDTDPTDLGTLPGDPLSSAAAINDHGLIVGYSGGGGYSGRAVAWVPRR